MICPNCSISFYDDRQWHESRIRGPGFNTVSDWVISTIICPSCQNPTVYLVRNESQIGGGDHLKDDDRHIGNLIHPRTIQHPMDGSVPQHLQGDYHEAWAVLTSSPKASAALSRRILQAMLSEQGYAKRNLVNQIDLVLHEPDQSKALPSGVRQIVDAVRQFGNFSAHPMTDATTLQVIDVEPAEAEWCLRIIEGLFDHYYVIPAANAKKLVELNQKLGQAGKTPAKQ